MRFLINTTVGVLGSFHFAKDWGYPDHDADFGMTLALWGLPEGPFLHLWVFGLTPRRRGSNALMILHLGGPGHHSARARLVAYGHQRDRSARAPS